MQTGGREMKAGTNAADATWVRRATHFWLTQFYTELDAGQMRNARNSKGHGLMREVCTFIRWFNEHNGIA